MADEKPDPTDDDAAEPVDASAVPSVDGDDQPNSPSDPSGDADDQPSDRNDRKAKADAVVAERKVSRRTVTSRRVTPKGGAKAAPSESKARDARKTESVATRKTPPTPTTGSYAKGPSPWWVPAIMFGLLVIGALLIMANYSRVLGEPNNIRLVVGLGFILGGIITATQYR